MIPIPKNMYSIPPRELSEAQLFAARETLRHYRGTDYRICGYWQSRVVRMRLFVQLRDDSIVRFWWDASRLTWRQL